MTIKISSQPIVDTNFSLPYNVWTLTILYNIYADWTTGSRIQVKTKISNHFTSMYIFTNDFTLHFELCVFYLYLSLYLLITANEGNLNDFHGLNKCF